MKRSGEELRVLDLNPGSSLATLGWYVHLPESQFPLSHGQAWFLAQEGRRCYILRGEKRRLLSHLQPVVSNGQILTTDWLPARSRDNADAVSVPRALPAS